MFSVVFPGRLQAVFLVGLVVVACGGEKPEPIAVCTVSGVNVTPPVASVANGETLALSASVTQKNCGTLSTIWSSSNAAVATISTDGVVTGVEEGSVTISAAAGGRIGTAAMTVTAARVRAVSITGAPAQAAIGVAVTLVAQLRDGAGRLMTGKQVRWSVSDGAVGTVGPGSAWTKCANEGGTCAYTGTRLVRFGSAAAFMYKELTGGTPCTVQVFGAFLDQVGKECSYADLFTSTGAATLRPVGTGSVTVTARAVDDSTIAGTVVVPVAAAGGRISHFGFFCTTCRLQYLVGQQERYWPVAFDPLENVLRVANSSTSSAAAVMSIAGTSPGPYTVTALSAGRVRLSFSAGDGLTGPPGFFDVNVFPPVVVAVGASILTVGETTPATGTLRDAQANVVPGAAFTWVSSKPSVATVNATTGVVTAVGGGTTTITGNAGGQSASATVRVAAPDQANVLAGGILGGQGIGRFNDRTGAPDPDGTSFDFQSAQTFTAGATGLLAQIMVPLFNLNGGVAPVTLEIRPVVAGAPDGADGAVLATATIPASRFATSNLLADTSRWVKVDMAPANFSVVAGQMYSYSLKTQSTVGYLYNTVRSSGYVSGAGYRRNRALTTTYTAFPVDYFFVTFVIPP